jgi:hypothetical protein
MTNHTSQEDQALAADLLEPIRLALTGQDQAANTAIFAILQTHLVETPPQEAFNRCNIIYFALLEVITTRDPNATIPPSLITDDEEWAPLLEELLVLYAAGSKEEVTQKVMTTEPEVLFIALVHLYHLAINTLAEKGLPE